MRREGRLPLLAGTAAGLVTAAVLTLLQSSIYRADASIALVRQGQPPGDDPALAQAAKAAAELFQSRAVAEPAIANLRLEESVDELLDRVSVRTAAESSLVRISVEAPSKSAARRTAQELTELATVLFNDRFGSRTTATIWETSHAEKDQVSPKPARNLAFGALLGALAGWVLAAVGRLPTRRPAVPRFQLPRPRLPKRAPSPVRAIPPPPVPVAEPESGPESRPGPESQPVPGPPAVVEAGSNWTVAAVERLLEEHGHAYPERAEELRIYADSFRDVAEADGSLPAGVTVVIEDVFADLIERTRRGGVESSP